MADKSISQAAQLTLESTQNGVIVRAAGQIVLEGPEVQLTFQAGQTFGVSLLVNQYGVSVLQPFWLLNLPSVDPHVANQIWQNNGVLMMSLG